MTTAVKKTISLPPDLAKLADELAHAEGKSLSAVFQDLLRAFRAEHLKGELREMQDYWQRKAREKGVMTQKDLDRYLGK